MRLEEGSTFRTSTTLDRDDMVEGTRNEVSEGILIEIKIGPGDLATAWDWYLKLVQLSSNSTFGFNA